MFFCFALLHIFPSIVIADEKVAGGLGASETISGPTEGGSEDKSAVTAADVSEGGSGAGLGTGKLTFIVADAVAGAVVIAASGDDDEGPVAITQH